MLIVVTVNAGNYQDRGVEYTNILYDSVRRNLPEGFEGKFVVFTDQPEGYDEGIEVRPLPDVLEGWWNKLALFKDGLFEEGDRIVYFDLSAVITGRLDSLMQYEGDFAILRDFFRPDGLQSSVMAWKVPKKWEPDTIAQIWTEYVKAGKPQVDPGGDQAWIEQTYPDAEILQEVFPKMFISYKLDGKRIPTTASVVIFHGQPKPHLAGGWVDLVWKVGGLARAELDEVCNTEKESVLSNVRSAIKRDVKWFDYSYKEVDKPVCIVGGGPSLRGSLNEIKFRKSIGHLIWSVNGTHDFLIKNGVIPDAYFMVDAREENVGFVKNPVKGVKYYIASMCHPSVFDALEGQDVTIFHCAFDGILGILKDIKDKVVHVLGWGTTGGLRAMLIAELFGSKEVSIYGMDSCITDVHHSYPQAQNDNDRIIDAVYGDRAFKCAPWHVGQAQEFIEFVQRFDGDVLVAGDGLLAHIARVGVPECPPDVRAREILSRLPDEPVGVEIGVFAGDLSRRLLAGREKMKLFLVDPWGDYDQSFMDSGGFHAGLSDHQHSLYLQKTKQQTEFAEDRRTIIRKKSIDAAQDVNEPLDFVFIDGDHSYEGCKIDIDSWCNKVKPGGWLMGHDYDNQSVPEGKLWGVDKAVQEFASKHGYEVELGQDYTWFIQLPKAA